MKISDGLLIGIIRTLIECDTNCLNLYALREIDDLVYQLRTTLSNCGLCKLPKKSETARRMLYAREKIQDEFNGNSTNRNETEEYPEDSRGEIGADVEKEEEQQENEKGGNTEELKMSQIEEVIKRREKEREAAEIAESKVSLPKETVIGKLERKDGEQVSRQYISVSLKELGDISEQEMPDEQDLCGDEQQVNSTTESQQNQHSQTQYQSYEKFWRSLKYNIYNSKDIVLTFQTLLTASFPQNIMQFAPSENQLSSWFPPSNWPSHSIIRVRGLESETIPIFKSQLSSLGIQCQTLVPPSNSTNSPFLFTLLPDSCIINRTGNASRQLIPETSFAEGVVRICKLHVTHSADFEHKKILHNKKLKIPAENPETTTRIIEPTLICSGIDVNPQCLCYPKFLFQRGRILLYLDRFSLSFPASPPPLSKALSPNNTITPQMEFMSIPRKRVGIAPTKDNPRRSAPQTRYGVASSVFYQRSITRNGKTFCTARNISVFPDDARMVPEVVLLVFLRHACLHGGILTAKYAGCDISHYITLPPQDLNSIVELRKWIEACMIKMFANYTRWPIERGPPDHVIALGNEEMQMAHVSFRDGDEARKELLRLLRKNGIIASVNSDTHSVHHPQAFFPALIIDDNANNEENEDEDSEAQQTSTTITRRSPNRKHYQQAQQSESDDEIEDDCDDFGIEGEDDDL